MRRFVHSSIQVVSGLALATGITPFAAPATRAQGNDAPTTATSSLKATGHLALPLSKASADNPDVPVKQATPKEPRVWAPLIQQTYPREAALAGLQGSVRIRVVVDQGGRVSDCLVLQTSGHGILDQAACEGMKRFAMFNPAIDASGSPTIGSYATIITYKMRTPQPQPRPQIAPSRPTTIT